MVSKTKSKRNITDKIIDIFIVIGITLVTLTCILPFLHVISLSLSSAEAIAARRVTFLPIGFNLDAYKKILKDSLMMSSFWYTIKLTFLSTTMSLTATVCMAYPLSRNNFKWKKSVTLLAMITMYIGGGTIPTYMLIQSLGMTNTIWSLTVPGLISVYNMIVMRSFFKGIPESLVESVRIDGGSEIRALISIILPLSKAVLATIALFYAVSRWNGYGDILYYISDPKLQTLQMRLQQLISQNQITQDAEDILLSGAMIETEAFKSAALIFATLPILVVYPYLQKYFVKGITLGSVKG